MSEHQVPQAPARGPGAPGAKGPVTHEQKQKRRKLIRRCIAGVVAVAIVAASAWALRTFVFKDDEGPGEVMTAMAYTDSIRSMVDGTGVARAKESAMMAPNANSVLLDLLVSEGDMVEAGQLLYNLDDAPAQAEIRTAQEGLTQAQQGVTDAQDGIADAQDAVTAANEAVTEAQNALAKAQADLEKAAQDEEQRKADIRAQIAALRTDAGALVLTAPYSGKLIDVKPEYRAGKTAGPGEEVATLVNDSQLRLSLYYSWAYADRITVGQSAVISLPTQMSSCPGVVEQINAVHRITPEGGDTFEVIFKLNNPGTLTQDTVASASLTAPDGTPIYPYSNGKLEYWEVTRLVLPTLKTSAVTSFPVKSNSMLNYAQVTKGQALVRLDDKPIQDEIAKKEKELTPSEDPLASFREAITQAEKSITQARKGVTDAEKGVIAAQKAVPEAEKRVEEAQKVLDEASKKLEEYHVVSPISGRVLSCTLTPGQPVESGQAVQIADTSTMLVDINIDERSIGFVTIGQMVDLQDQSGNYFMGEIRQLSLTAKSENGVAVFPAVVEVPNPDGMLMTGTYIQYQFIASQSENCLVVPVQAVIKVSLPDPSMGGDFPAEGDLSMNGDLPAEDGFPAGDMSLEDMPVEDMPVEDVPLEDMPAEDVPVEDVPVEDVPVEDIPVEDAPMEDMPELDMGMDGMMGGGAMGSFEDPGSATVCFVQGEPDDRAIPADESWNVPEGFFPVIVTTGLSDDTNVEIRSGLYEGDTVFTGYITDSASTDGMY